MVDVKVVFITRACESRGGSLVQCNRSDENMSHKYYFSKSINFVGCTLAT